MQYNSERNCYNRFLCELFTRKIGNTEQQSDAQLWERFLLESLQGQGKKNGLYRDMKYVCAGEGWELCEELENSIRLQAYHINKTVYSKEDEKEKRSMKKKAPREEVGKEEEVMMNLSQSVHLWI